MTNPTNQASGVAEPDALHNAIMNLQAPEKTRSELDGAPKGFYLLGFRDARHAAAELVAAALAAQPAAPAEVVAEVAICCGRRECGGECGNEWQGTQAAPKHLDDPRLQQLFGDAIEGALAFGFQGNNAPPDGHWLWRFWNIGNAERALRTPAQAPSTEPAAWLRFWAWQGLGNAESGPDNETGYELCKPTDKGIDGSDAFPVYATPHPAVAVPARLVAAFEKRKFFVPATLDEAIASAANIMIEDGTVLAHYASKAVAVPGSLTKEQP